MRSIEVAELQRFTSLSRGLSAQMTTWRRLRGLIEVITKAQAANNAHIPSLTTRSTAERNLSGLSAGYL